MRAETMLLLRRQPRRRQVSQEGVGEVPSYLRRVPCQSLDGLYLEWSWTLVRVCTPSSSVDTELIFSEVLVIFGYIVTILVCLTMDSQLITNPNRGGMS